MPYELAGMSLVLVVFAGLIIGFSKTAVAGLGTIAAAIFATQLPTKESTGVVLILLIIADTMALLMYRRDANWKLLRHLLPAMLPGIILGTIILTLINNDTLRIWIGVLILVMVALQLIVSWRNRGTQPVEKHHHPVVSWLTGGAAGVATMTANAAGPITTLYLVSTGIDKKRFLGTAAWFYMIGNLIKVPFSAGIGLMPPATLLLTLMLAPAVIVGGLIGRSVVKRLNETWFTRAILAGSVVAAVAVLIS
ncbi:sulfite exporter TauE/SafE family protein [Propionibacteriaceae bacterium Y2011]|uniref:sulfite exporter TauE/SafE family protein n=1 Tax=Microlunatus sp. Y2014 TaxID=3418488 RepID=UPI003B48D5FD